MNRLRSQEHRYLGKRPMVWAAIGLFGLTGFGLTAADFVRPDEPKLGSELKTANPIDRHMACEESGEFLLESLDQGREVSFIFPSAYSQNKRKTVSLMFSKPHSDTYRVGNTGEGTTVTRSELLEHPNGYFPYSINVGNGLRAMIRVFTDTDRDSQQYGEVFAVAFCLDQTELQQFKKDHPNPAVGRVTTG